MELASFCNMQIFQKNQLLMRKIKAIAMYRACVSQGGKKSQHKPRQMRV